MVYKTAATDVAIYLRVSKTLAERIERFLKEARDDGPM
jgi:hypothetical protein